MKHDDDDRQSSRWTRGTGLWLNVFVEVLADSYAVRPAAAPMLTLPSEQPFRVAHFSME